MEVNSSFFAEDMQGWQRYILCINSIEAVAASPTIHLFTREVLGSPIPTPTGQDIVGATGEPLVNSHN